MGFVSRWQIATSNPCISVCMQRAKSKCWTISTDVSYGSSWPNFKWMWKSCDLKVFPYRISGPNCSIIEKPFNFDLSNAWAEVIKTTCSIFSHKLQMRQYKCKYRILKDQLNFSASVKRKKKNLGTHKGNIILL